MHVLTMIVRRRDAVDGVWACVPRGVCLRRYGRGRDVQTGQMSGTAVCDGAADDVSYLVVWAVRTCLSRTCKQVRTGLVRRVGHTVVILETCPVESGLDALDSSGHSTSLRQLLQSCETIE